MDRLRANTQDPLKYLEASLYLTFPESSFQYAEFDAKAPHTSCHLYCLRPVECHSQLLFDSLHYLNICSQYRFLSNQIPTNLDPTFLEIPLDLSPSNALGPVVARVVIFLFGKILSQNILEISAAKALHSGYLA